MKHILSFVLVMGCSLVVSAQIPTEGQLAQKMDFAVDLMNQGKYQAADKELKYSLS